MKFCRKKVGKAAAAAAAVLFSLTLVTGCGRQGLPGGEASPDITPPSVRIINPPDGCTVDGTVTVTLEASDDTGIALLELYKDGVLVTDFTDVPYEYMWDTTGEPEEEVCCLLAAAYDAAGNYSKTNEISVRIDNEQVWNNVGEADFTEDFGGEGKIVAGKLRFFIEEATDTLYVGLITGIKGTNHPLGNGSGAVMEYSGGNWEIIGGEGFVSGLTSIPSFDMYILEGVPYIAYIDTTDEDTAVVKRYNGTGWEPLSGDFSLPAACTLVSLHVQEDEGVHIPWVLAVSGGGATAAESRVYTYENGEWSPVGSPLSQAEAAEICFSGSGEQDVPLILWSDSSGEIHISQYDGSKCWNPLEGGTFSGSDPAAWVYNGEIYTIYAGGQTGALKRYAAKWDGTEWNHIGCSPATEPIMDVECASGSGTAAISVCGGNIFVFIEEAADLGGTARFLQHASEWEELEALSGDNKKPGETAFEVVNGYPYRAYLSPGGFVNVEKWY